MNDREAWEKVALALGRRVHESLNDAARRCLRDNVGRQDVAYAVLDITPVVLEGVSARAALRVVAELCDHARKEGAMNDHDHCPRGCEKPQPGFIVGGEYAGKWYCRRCWVQGGVLTIMAPCTPEFCGDDVYAGTALAEGVVFHRERDER